MFYLLRLFWPNIRVTASIPLAQAYHESAGWTSALYKQGNNMFGMKPATARQSTANGSILIGKMVYARFACAFDSIRDFYKWMDYFKISTDEELLAHISKNYATDKAYLYRIQAIRVKLAPQLISPALASSLIGGATLATCYGAYRGVNALADA